MFPGRSRPRPRPALLVSAIIPAAQAATALVAVAGAGIGLSFLDPIAALFIAAIALKEGRDGWRGEDTCCTPMPGLDATLNTPSAAACDDDCCT